MDESERTERDEQLLAEVACGERGLDDLEVVARISGDPGFAARLDEAARIGATLGAALAEERDVLSRATRSGPAPGEDGLRSVIGEPTALPRRRGAGRWLRVAAVAAAAVLLVLAGVAVLGPEEPHVPRDDVDLGPTDVVFDGVATTAGRLVEVRWRSGLPDGTLFVVTVVDPANEALIARSAPLASSPWVLDAVSSGATEAHQRVRIRIRAEGARVPGPTFVEQQVVLR